MRWFAHSGDIGDIIYSMPTIRAAGGGSLRIFDAPGKTAHGMTEEKVARIRPLLESQDYISEVVWSVRGEDDNLNGFRDHYQHGNLADMHLATYGFDWTHREKKWLCGIEPDHRFDVIVHRSARYHNHGFPWRRIIETYAGRVGFVGHEDELAAFNDEFGVSVPYVAADDFLSLARVISGSLMYVGNSSSPLAVAHGLKHKTIMEITACGAQHLAVFQRMDCIIGWDAKLELPKL